MNTAIAAQPSRVEVQIEDARTLATRNAFPEALATLERVLGDVPENRDALYLAAVCRRYLGRCQGALATLRRLERSDPGYARLYQERGHCFRDLGDYAAALHAFERAVSLNPALPASWKALTELYRKVQRPADEAHAKANFQHLSDQPEVLVSVASHLYEGSLHKAEELCRHFLRSNGHHIEGMRLLAAIGLRLNVLDDAEFLLESCVELTPQHAGARYDYVNVLHRRQKYAKAHEHAAILRDAEPGNRRLEVLYANQCVALGEYETALAIYGAMLRDVPGDQNMHLARGNTLKTMGRQREAIEAYKEAYAAKADYGEAYWSLANLKTYQFTGSEVARMREQEASQKIDDLDRYHLCFALGKALEDLGKISESFAYYERGNFLKKQERPYVPEYMERDMRLQAEICTAEFFAMHAGAGCKSPDPIFIVGLPRAGSTLLEQILASHSQVDGTQELPNILALAHSLDRKRRVDEEPSYPDSLKSLSPQQLVSLGEQYLDETRVYRADGRFLIDKMPNNFRHIGLIHLILPNAKIIDARRDPMACCFSGFKQLFVEGQEFTYGLSEIGQYYRNYIDLMAHWNAVLPGKILQVRYEDVVADLETSVRRILSFCDLEYEPACLEFHKTERTVRTASSEQVRRPIFREGLDQWRDFEDHLGPLRAALGRSAEN